MLEIWSCCIERCGRSMLMGRKLVILWIFLDIGKFYDDFYKVLLK